MQNGKTERQESKTNHRYWESNGVSQRVKDVGVIEGILTMESYRAEENGGFQHTSGATPQAVRRDTITPLPIVPYPLMNLRLKRKRRKPG